MRAELRGHCADLQPEVVDKYYFPPAPSTGFVHHIGRVICGNCPIQRECLEAAIVEPPGVGMRGGATNAELWRLYDQLTDEYADIDELVDASIKHQQLSTAGQLRSGHYKKGRFTNPPLALPELGGAYAS